MNIPMKPFPKLKYWLASILVFGVINGPDMSTLHATSNNYGVTGTVGKVSQALSTRTFDGKQFRVMSKVWSAKEIGGGKSNRWQKSGIRLV